MNSYVVPKNTEPDRQQIVVIAGPPAGGKGTLCKNIREHFDLVHVSTGAMLRKTAESDTKLAEIMARGSLVDDDIVFGALKTWFAANKDARGVLLDGFPRNKKQADMLRDFGLRVAAFVLLEVEDTECERYVPHVLCHPTDESIPFLPYFRTRQACPESRQTGSRPRQGTKERRHERSYLDASENVPRRDRCIRKVLRTSTRVARRTFAQTHRFNRSSRHDRAGQEPVRCVVDGNQSPALALRECKAKLSNALPSLVKNKERETSCCRCQ